MNEEVVGIVLKESDYKDSAVLLSVLTKEYGKISFVAQGVRKMKSKMAGFVLPFMKSSFVFDYKDGKSMFRFKNASRLETRRHIRSDYILSAVASVVCEICDVLTIERDHIELSYFLYDLLEEALSLLEEGKRYDIVLALFLAQVLNEIGIGPIVDYCVLCEKETVRTIDVQEGGFLCESCAAKKNLPPHSTSELKAFRLLNKANYSHYEIVSSLIEDAMPYNTILISFFRIHGGMAVKSYAVLEEFLRVK